jgi:hypothetical protein
MQPGHQTRGSLDVPKGAGRLRPGVTYPEPGARHESQLEASTSPSRVLIRRLVSIDVIDVAVHGLPVLFAAPILIIAVSMLIRRSGFNEELRLLDQAVGESSEHPAWVCSPTNVEGFLWAGRPIGGTSPSGEDSDLGFAG